MPNTCAHTATVARNRLKEASAIASSKTDRIMITPHDLRTQREHSSLIVHGQAGRLSDSHARRDRVNQSLTPYVRAGCARWRPPINSCLHGRRASDHHGFASVQRHAVRPFCARRTRCECSRHGRPHRRRDRYAGLGAKSSVVRLLQWSFRRHLQLRVQHL